MILSGIQWLKKPLKSKSLDSRFRGNDTKKTLRHSLKQGREIVSGIQKPLRQQTSLGYNGFRIIV
jgi:hypothetical protein